MDRRPIRAVWNGVAFLPDVQERSYCKHWFKVGEVFVIDPQQERDMNSHRHYFAQLKSSWMNLPEKLMHKYPTEEIFRKKLLIETGYFNESEVVCDTDRDAATVAAFMAPLDPAATIVVHGNVIKTYVAKSQNLTAMSREEFQQSKWAVLDAAAALIDVTPKQLERNAGREA